MKLETLALACGYPGKTVCRNIDAEVAEGRITCLLGPNGSGKTTLFRTLLGLLKPHGGDVLLGGRSLAALSRREIARAIAYVPQAQTSVFPYRVADMVTMGRTAHLGPFASPGQADKAAAARALDRLGIAELGDAEYTRLSGGQRQLVLIARALAQEAPIMVMDEPTASLDFGNQVRVLSEIVRLSRDRLAVVLSTHAPDQPLAIADEVLLLDGGVIAARGAPEDVLTGDRLAQVYGVTVDVERLANGQAVCVPDYVSAINRRRG